MYGNTKHVKKAVYKGLSIVLLLALALGWAPAAYAFDGRAGESITVPADEVVNDDLYISGATVTINGTVKGDLVAGARTLIINGTIEGDAIVSGAEIIINGEIQDDFRGAGASIVFGDNASVGDDVVAAGYNLETKSSSAVTGDLVWAGSQAVLAGSIGESVWLASRGVELYGKIGGDLEASVDRQGSPSSFFMPWVFFPDARMPEMPDVKSGLNLGNEASIGGELTLKSPDADLLQLDEAQIQGGIERVLDPVRGQEDIIVEPPNPALDWFFGLLRRMATLMIVGLLLAWMLASIIVGPAEKMRTETWPSLGWGLAIALLFPAVLFLLMGLFILLGVFFGALSLGNLATNVIFSGIVVFLTLTGAFVIAVTYLAKLAAAYLVGRWILGRLAPAAAEKVIWPVLLGVVIVALALSIPWLGVLVNILITLFGLGALFLHLRTRRSDREATPTVAPMAPAAA